MLEYLEFLVDVVVLVGFVVCVWFEYWFDCVCGWECVDEVVVLVCVF